MVGDIGTRGHRRHSPVNGIESKGLTEKVSWRLGGATDAAQFDDLAGVDTAIEEGPNDRG